MGARGIMATSDRHVGASVGVRGKTTTVTRVVAPRTADLCHGSGRN